MKQDVCREPVTVGQALRKLLWDLSGREIEDSAKIRADEIGCKVAAQGGLAHFAFPNPRLAREFKTLAPQKLVEHPAFGTHGSVDYFLGADSVLTAGENGGILTENDLARLNFLEQTPPYGNLATARELHERIAQDPVFGELQMPRDDSASLQRLLSLELVWDNHIDVLGRSATPPRNPKFSITDIGRAVAKASKS